MERAESLERDVILAGVLRRSGAWDIWPVVYRESTMDTMMDVGLWRAVCVDTGEEHGPVAPLSWWLQDIQFFDVPTPAIEDRVYIPYTPGSDPWESVAAHFGFSKDDIAWEYMGEPDAPDVEPLNWSKGVSFKRARRIAARQRTGSPYAPGHAAAALWRAERDYWRDLVWQDRQYLLY